MKNIYLILLVIFVLVTIQNCTSIEKTSKTKTEMKTEKVDEEHLRDVHELKDMHVKEPTDESALDKEKLKQPVEFGMHVKQVQELFPVHDKFEYDPMVNRKVTILVRDVSGGRFTFCFYEDKLYKIITTNKWSGFALRYAKDNISNTVNVFLENYGKPDFEEGNETHKKMTWIKEDLELTLEEFSSMSHQGVSKILSLIYADRNITTLAASDESFDWYKTAKQKDMIMGQ